MNIRENDLSRCSKHNYGPCLRTTAATNCPLHSIGQSSCSKSKLNLPDYLEIIMGASAIPDDLAGHIGVPTARCCDMLATQGPKLEQRNTPGTSGRQWRTGRARTFVKQNCGTVAVQLEPFQINDTTFNDPRINLHLA